MAVVGTSSTAAILNGGDGQPKHRGDMSALQDVFVLSKRHEKFLYGQSDHFGRGYLLIYGLVSGFIIIVAAGPVRNLVYGTAYRGPTPPELILVIMLIPLIIGMFWIRGLIRQIREDHLYETQGQLLVGQIAGTKTILHSRSYEVDVMYEVRCASGELCKGSRAQMRTDLARAALPPVGTPVAVLFVDMAHHLLL